ncbi:2-oxoglutarate:acceptor oxidoreductase [Campylobacter coli]|nr:2-oxoglutarate:acceptor oxidoreductase [Campylobacter coli]
MNLEDLAKKTISEVSSIMEEQRRQSEILKEQEELRKTQIQEDMPTVKLKEEPILEQELEDKISMAKFEEEQKIQEEIKNLDELNQENKEPVKEEAVLQSEILNPIAEVQTLNEDIFLKHLRERILVLFEGLNSVKEENLEHRLQLTINFLEFLLANIEDKLKK